MTYRAKTEAERLLRRSIRRSRDGNRRRKRTIWDRVDCPQFCRCHDPRRVLLDQIHLREMRESRWP